MAKKNTDSLTGFDFLDDIEKEFNPTSPNSAPKEETGSKEKNKTSIESLSSTNPTSTNTIVKQGRPSGYFVQQFHEELRMSGVKNITIYEKVHEQLHDLVYHISKAHTKEGKDRVTMLGVSVKALLIGIEELKKTYQIE
jgi:hypothetical protein